MRSEVIINFNLFFFAHDFCTINMTFNIHIYVWKVCMLLKIFSKIIVIMTKDMAQDLWWWIKQPVDIS